MHHIGHQIVAFIHAHPDLAILVVGGTAFGESFAFLSLLFPGTAILIAAGAMVKAGVIAPVPVAIAGALGAIFGDAISYWLGWKFEPVLARSWPFRAHPERLEGGFAFFRRYGWASVFLGRFFGPLRAIVPIVAGMMEMPPLPFYLANILSAVVWAPTLLLSGYLIGDTVMSGWSVEDKLLVAAGAVTLIVAAGFLVRRAFQVR
jgi:membrane protein DedA with SNARE-associated domain